MKKEYVFYFYLSWIKEKVVATVDNGKMRKGFFKTRMEGAYL